MRSEDWRVRRPAPDDETVWRELYTAYAAFYDRPMPAESAGRVWDWIHDDAHEVECLLVGSADRGIVGLAHFRDFARPLAASVGGYLDDLFVAPEARGTGAVDALMAALREIGIQRGWTVVRWITADDNYRARATYDRIARRTAWITYDMALDAT